MATWYGQGQTRRYPGHQRLDGVNRRLSRLDSCFKTLWDECPDESERGLGHA